MLSSEPDSHPRHVSNTKKFKSEGLYYPKLNTISPLGTKKDQYSVLDIKVLNRTFGIGINNLTADGGPLPLPYPKLTKFMDNFPLF